MMNVTLLGALLMVEIVVDLMWIQSIVGIVFVRNKESMKTQQQKSDLASRT